MKSTKKILVAIIVILILLLISGGAFAYVYLSTDILKTDRQLFFKYFSQIILEDGFVDSNISKFNEKKMQSPYENSGEITVEVNFPEEEADEKILEKVNDLSVKFTGQIDSVNKKTEQNIEIDYGNDVIFPIKYKQDSDKFGIQIDELSKKYIAIRNENLKQFVAKFDEEDASEFPDKIDFSNINQEPIFTNEELEQLKQIYLPIVQEILVEENFSSIKTEQNESYTMELTNEQIKNIIIKLLEATKQKSFVIDKINKLVLEHDSEAELLDATVIDDLVEMFAEVDVSDIPNLKLTLVQSNKILNQIIVQSGESQISIEKIKTNSELKYNAKLQVKEEIIASNSIIEEQSSSGQINIFFNIQYNGLDNLNNVQESYQFGFNTIIEEQTMGYNYKINTNTQFADSVSIDNLDESAAVFLNDYDEAKVTNFLTQVGTKIGEINKRQMEELGLKEEENPLLYSNPITMILFSFKSDVDNAMEHVSIQEIEAFNQSLTMYEGEDVRGTNVIMMIQTVSNRNLSTELEGQENTFVDITLDGNQILDTQNIDSNKLYDVEAMYNEDGRVSEMRVTTKN